MSEDFLLAAAFVESIGFETSALHLHAFHYPNTPVLVATIGVSARNARTTAPLPSTIDSPFGVSQA
jgi:hypothetical protein